MTILSISIIPHNGTWTYTWKVGRQLARMTGTGDTVDFTYNADGLRVRKESTVRGVTEYTLRSWMN